jgi:adenylate cyclase
VSTTRHIAAILAADVAGYSRLMGADEEGRLKRLKVLRRSVSIRRSPSTTTASPGLTWLDPGTRPATACWWSFASVVDAVRCPVAVHHTHRSQFSLRSPSIRANSASLFVTIV